MLQNPWPTDIALPPPELLPRGRQLTISPEQFHRSSCEAVDLLAGEIGFAPSSTILDIGCGVGRLPIGLLARKTRFAAYLGADVVEAKIDWCREHLAVHDARLEFVRIDMRNERYNPAGQAGLPLMVPPRSFDMVNAFAVFTHLREPDLRAYLELIARALRPGGMAFATAYVADQVPPVSENPSGLGPIAWHGPLHCVLYERGLFHRIVADSALLIEREIRRVSGDGQAGYLLSALA
jgi:SAM-dependent methyltransferase